MALSKQTILSHDVRGAYKTINEITDTNILDDGVQVSSARHRGGPIPPGALVDDVYVSTDTSGHSADVQGLAAACWSPAVHTAYEASLRAATS